MGMEGKERRVRGEEREGKRKGKGRGKGLGTPRICMLPSPMPPSLDI
jgi:hypothetical protein